MSSTVKSFAHDGSSENRTSIVRFSFSAKHETFDSIVALLGLDSESVIWKKLPGLYGYDFRYESHGISICVAGPDSYSFSSKLEGVYVDLDRKGCRFFNRYGNGNWKQLIMFISDRLETSECVVNRLDLRYDDCSGVFDLDAIATDVSNGTYTSRFRYLPLIEKRGVGDHLAVSSVSFGRKFSDVLILFSDELVDEYEGYCDHFVSSRIVLRHSLASSAVFLLAGNIEEGSYYPLFSELTDLFFAVLNNYVQFT